MDANGREGEGEKVESTLLAEVRGERRGYAKIHSRSGASIRG